MKNNYIPNIDISSLVSSDFSDNDYQNVAKEIKKASEEVGFFTVTGHGISNEKIEQILSTCRHFFYSPDEEKIKIAPKKWNANTDTVYRGYFPSSVNGKEGFEVNHDMSYLNPNWQSIIDDYYNSVFDLGLKLFKSIISVYSNNLNLADQAFVRPKTLSTLRFNFYPKQDKPVEVSAQDGVALGCETHVDSGIMTILYQDKKGGLQVQNRHTLEWHDVPHDPNAYVVNTGLALEYLTNGKMKATNHRVLFNQEERISIPFFFEPSYDFKLDPKYLEISEDYKYDIDNYENFLTNSLKKFVEYDRPN